MDNTLYKYPKDVRKEFLELNRKIAIVNSKPSTGTTVVQSSSGSSGTTVVIDSNATYAKEVTNTGNVNFGVISRNYIFEEMKCIVTVAAPVGTTFKVIDELGNVVIKPGEIVVDQIGAFTWNGNKRISADMILMGIFLGITTEVNVEMVFIKKIWKII